MSAKGTRNELGGYVSTAIIVQLLISGTLLGGLYALVAFGLSLIYGVVRILNFAHGTLLCVAGIIASIVFARWGLNPILIAAALVPVFFVFGYVMYVTLLQPLRSRNAMQFTVGTVLVTVGLLLILSDLTSLVAGATTKNIQLPFHAFIFGDVIVSSNQLYILLGIVVMTIALHLFLTRTWFGRAIRAVTQDPVGAQICGIRSHAIHAATVGVGVAIVAIAGVLYVLSFPVDPYAGFELTVKAFTIIILGGIGNLVGALLAGIFLGLAEAVTGFYWASEWAPAVSIVLLLIILVVFPKGVLTRGRT
jgi:branched-chain amino acid transport system permease protein